MKTMMPNDNNLIMTVNGRTYTGTSGIPISNVPDHDAAASFSNTTDLYASVSYVAP